jgi:hypothetical protein
MKGQRQVRRIKTRTRSWRDGRKERMKDKQVNEHGDGLISGCMYVCMGE